MNRDQDMVLRLLADPRRQLYLQKGGGYVLTHSAAERSLYRALSDQEVAELLAAELIEPAWDGAEPHFYKLSCQAAKPTEEGANHA
ncbi:hypothetical protein [Bordetella bronchiseptica]|uniref:hypothetical protein n=1 Tax=Bordetella bronchiseptica TaxID=518 RepID=UPI000528D232|nr:hypothetical protein [Bordetella bronchiseptica]AWP80968.1 hypothetical protein B7P04_17310 [Bordetella bronchiseptica]AWQ11336.1 hypothetical protein B9G72_17255 [Bordetella bronchiseptica]AZW13648.1 hypothetical protein CS344_17095 [Bordetella bronchiseptica]